MSQEPEKSSDYTRPEEHLPAGVGQPTTPLNIPVTDPGANLPAIHEATREKDPEKTISPSLLHPAGEEAEANAQAEHLEHDRPATPAPVEPSPGHGDEPPQGHVPAGS